MTPRSKDDELDEDRIVEALHGDRAAARAAMSKLYDFYAPSVHYAVGWACRACAYFNNTDDLRQEVWRRLLERNAKLLRYYDPERGKLGRFIRTLAYQQALAVIHAERRQETVAGEKLAMNAEELRDSETSQFVAQMIQGDFFGHLMARARSELDELDVLLLQEIRLKGRTMAVVATEIGQSIDALYKRNERLKGKLATLARELLNETTPGTKHSAAVRLAVLTAMTAALTSLRSLPL